VAGGAPLLMKERLTLVLLGWAAAFIVVMALFLAFGDTLEDLPVPLRALTISGVLTVAMTQLAMPLISRFLRSRSRPR
jgi:antibiotic biosynthesis monooxygenase (ABM) superfamily enzyme